MHRTVHSGRSWSAWGHDLGKVSDCLADARLLSVGSAVAGQVAPDPTLSRTIDAWGAGARHEFPELTERGIAGSDPRPPRRQAGPRWRLGRRGRSEDRNRRTTPLVWSGPHASSEPSENQHKCITLPWANTGYGPPVFAPLVYLPSLPAVAGAGARPTSIEGIK